MLKIYNIKSINIYILNSMYHKSWEELFNRYKFNFDNLYNNNIVFPPKKDVFRVFEMDVKKIRLVLLGQDPYHNDGQAHGLSFSVPNDIKIPPSLVNIFKELNLEFPDRKYKFTSGNLEKWFYNEKIFLLNASLTVEKNKPNSHYKFWQDFTDDVIRYIDIHNKKCVFLLLGNFAKNKKKFITNEKMIVMGIHPSPLSAHNGFFNSNIFSKVENILKETINWQN